MLKNLLSSFKTYITTLSYIHYTLGWNYKFGAKTVDQPVFEQWYQVITSTNVWLMQISL